MTFLFGRGTPREKLAFILRATKQHALNLGTFTPLYKFITIALRRLFEAVGGKGDVPNWVDCTVYVFEDHGIVLAESQDARGLAQGQAQAD